MSVETRAVDGRPIDWRNGIAAGEMVREGHRAIEVGSYAFDYTEFHIGIFEFLGGAKHIELNDDDTNRKVGITIPDSTQGLVQMGELQIPYQEYVKGVMWAMAFTGGHISEEHQWPLHYSFLTALDSLKKDLLSKVPDLNKDSLDIAHGLRTEHKQPGGIREARGFERRGITFRPIR